MPWYVQALLLSQPLHWAVLDLVTIVVLGSGGWLWWRRGSAA